MEKKSAGILVYRLENSYLEVFLAHPGGPFFKNKDLGAWSIPKGEFTDEDPVEAARREFLEETGINIQVDLTYLGETKLKTGKIVFCWTAKGNFDHKNIVSNSFEIEWPPKSGKKQTYPEIDKGEWFTVQKAKEKIHPNQVAFIERLISTLQLSDTQIYPGLKEQANADQLSLF